MSLKLTASNDQLKKQFFALRTPEDMANLLEIDYSRLKYHLYIIKRFKETYTTFPVSKKSGGNRQISAPVTALKIIQRKLNQVLQQVYQPKPSAHGFILEKSIVTNAEEHTKRSYILNIDLKDFFPSINFGRVRGLFMATPYNLNGSVATVLAQICCYRNELPQGAPTSPIVSNMICAKMDSQLQKFAKQHRCFYTRYADDVTFSTYLRAFPVALAKFNSTGEVAVGNEIRRIINENGFKINSDKVRLQTKYRRQEVTGLTTNEFPNVKRKYVRQIRAMLHAWRKFGLEDAEREFLNKYDRKHRSPYKAPPSFKLIVKGKIEFLGMVRGKDSPIYRRFCDQLRELAPDLAGEPVNPTAHLLEVYDELASSKNSQRRGYLLQELMTATLKFYGIRVRKSFVRNQGAEQIDGAFILDGWYYIVECRWRKKLADIRELDGLYGQVNRSGRQTVGFFLSINGWSKKVLSVLKQNPEKCIILMDGNDFRRSLTGEVNFKDLIRQKIEKLNFDGEPHYSVSQYLKDHGIT